MTQKLIHPEDARIERTDTAAALTDTEGCVQRSFPYSWTDEMIMEALYFANWAYAQGWHAGAMDKAREIRSALELK